MRIALRQVVLWSFIVSLAAPVRAGEAAYKKCQFYRGITEEFAVTEVIEADVNADGSDETLIAYRESEDALNQRGGLLILRSGPSGCQVAWHAMFERVFPEKITTTGPAITIGFVWKTAEGAKRVKKTFVVGKDLFFRGQEKNTFSKVTVKASSTLRKDGVEPGKVFDGDLKTGWAEGAEGTGVDETLTIELGQPVSIALVGVLHGNFRGKRQWLDNNRLHRAEITVETKSDRYDVESDVDFGEDLGLGLYGDRLEMSFGNRPMMHYFKVSKRDVLSLEMKITSVLLGDKNDDTWVSEIDLVQLIPSKVILGEQDPGKGKKKAPAADENKTDDQEDWTDDF